MNKESSKHGINCKLGVDENQIKILFVCHGNICPFSHGGISFSRHGHGSGTGRPVLHRFGGNQHGRDRQSGPPGNPAEDAGAGNFHGGKDRGADDPEGL